MHKSKKGCKDQETIQPGYYLSALDFVLNPTAIVCNKNYFSRQSKRKIIFKFRIFEVSLITDPRIRGSVFAFRYSI